MSEKMLFQPPLLSVVVPCLNEEACILEFHRRMTAACEEIPGVSFEVIYINDGSSDKTLDVIIDLQRSDARITIIDLARNHGHQIALSAGLAHAKGERVLAIDADLQDPPELLKAMWVQMDAGADVVYGKRNRRQGESILKRATAFAFYRLLGSVTNVPIPIDAGDFRLMSRRVVNILVSMPESHRFVRGMVAWIGLTQVPVCYDRDPRYAGVTKYSPSKMLGLALDAFTAFAAAPLRLVFLMATLSALLAGILLAWAIYSYLYLDAIPGWASLMVVFLFFTSVQLFALAVIGEYVGRIFMQTKNRPLYVVKAVHRSQNSLQAP